MNIFGKKKKGEYKYIWVDKKGRIQMFGLVFANTNTNTNISHTLIQSNFIGKPTNHIHISD